MQAARWSAVLLAAACAAPPPERPSGTLRYEGSSTVAIFVRGAEGEYGAIDFDIDTTGESEGGEAAILAGSADLAGVAQLPRAETLASGVNATLIGRDAIAVIVNERNPIRDLSKEQLRALFSGEVSDWSELGAFDASVEVFTASLGSATREVFRSALLGSADYGDVRVAERDADIVASVARTDGGIGHLSFSFLDEASGVHPTAIDGEEPIVTNFDYPVSRPLYLLWRAGEPLVESFVAWSESREGQAVVMRDFVGARVLASVSGSADEPNTGTLVVETETFPVYDGGIYYYPHRPYEILALDHTPLRRVRNHRGENDEEPTHVPLAPGTYLIHTRTSQGTTLEFLVTVEAGSTTVLDVARAREEAQ